MDIDSLVGAPARAKAAVVDRLHPKWPNILQRAWSLRFIEVAFVLSAIEAMIPLFINTPPPIPTWLFALLIGAICGLAWIARLTAQKNMGVSE